MASFLSIKELGNNGGGILASTLLIHLKIRMDGAMRYKFY
nr:hypothetical protein [Bacillus paralicheniformis]